MRLTFLMTKYLWKIRFRLESCGTNFDDSGRHPASYSTGTVRAFTCIKRLGPEARDLPLSAASVRNELSCTSMESTLNSFTFNLNYINPQ